MVGSGELTPALLKKHSGQFDTEGIYNLTLNGQGLTTLKNISTLCPNLSELDVSNNNIDSTRDIIDLPKLRKLVLKKNNIRRLEGLNTGLDNLNVVHLQGNHIMSVDDLGPLSNLQTLEVIYLKNVDGSQANPVCDVTGYRTQMLELFPHLRNLDGERLTPGAPEFYKNVEIPLDDDDEPIELPPPHDWTRGFNWDLDRSDVTVDSIAPRQVAAFNTTLNDSKKAVASADSLIEFYKNQKR